MMIRHQERVRHPILKDIDYILINIPNYQA